MAEIKVKLAQTHQGIGGVSIDQNNQRVGVNITSGGLSEVIHDETLKGRGTNANPLGIATSVLNDIESRVEKTSEADKVYGTDENGEQTTYDLDSFGKVDDVLVDGTSVVENKIAEIDLTGKVDKTTDADKVYGTDNNGDQTTYNIDSFGKVDDVKVNGTSVVTNKVANVSVPTAVSELTNDSDYQTGSQVSSAISTHNTSNTAHDDIRQLISGLDEWETDTITATTTNYQLNHTYSISEAFQRAADLFEGYWNAITSINDVIPSQATSQNQLADKNFVNSSIAANAANFRGNWETWADVPTQASDYPEDYIGNKKPANNDYMVVDDAEDYGSEYTGSWRFIYIGDWDTDGKSGWLPAYRIGHAFTAAQWAAINSNITATMVSDYVDPTSQASTAYNLRITSLESDKRDVINASYKIYATDGNGANLDTLGYSQTATASTIAQRDANGELEVATPTVNSSATTKLYVDTLAGTKQDKLTTAQMAAVNSTITSAKVTSYDNHLVDTNNPHQVTKAQVGLGNVDNTSDLDKPISTATQTALNAKQNTLTAGTNITIQNNVISATDTTYTAGDGIGITNNEISTDNIVWRVW